MLCVLTMFLELRGVHAMKAGEQTDQRTAQEALLPTSVDRDLHPLRWHQWWKRGRAVKAAAAGASPGSALGFVSLADLQLPNAAAGTAAIGPEPEISRRDPKAVRDAQAPSFFEVF